MLINNTEQLIHPEHPEVGVSTMWLWFRVPVHSTLHKWWKWSIEVAEVVSGGLALLDQRIQRFMGRLHHRFLRGRRRMGPQSRMPARKPPRRRRSWRL